MKLERLLASDADDAIWPWVGDETPSSSPAARHYHNMAYDSESDRVLLFGGWAGRQTNETWAYDYQRDEWVEMNPSSAPSPRDAFAMAYDSQSDRAILYGGATATGGVFGDTWAYDFNNDSWIEMTPAESPPARLGARIAYDANADRIVLFGGHNAEIYGDTWTYDFDANTWNETTPAIGPSRRAWQAMAYDCESSRVVLFGGDLALASLDDTWTYDLANNTWTQMNPSETPGRRSKIMAAYDAESDRTVVFGGSSGPGETWVYDLNGDEWTEMEVQPRPPDRNAHAMVYATTPDRVILFGGSWPLGRVDSPSVIRNNETWAYDFNANAWTLRGPRTPPGAPLNLAAAQGEGTIDLRWTAPSFEGSSPIANYTVYQGGSLLSMIPSPVSLTYEDGDVTEGVTYVYQVSASNDAGEGPPSNEVPATVPSAPPTVTITTPLEGALRSSRFVSIAGAASDNFALARVDIRANGADWVLATGTSSWSGTLALVEGPNTIDARAQDTSGNEAVASVSLVVDTIDPSVTIVSPTSDEILSSRQVTVTGTAEDNLGVARVEIGTDGADWVSADGTSSWSGDVALREGPNTIHVRAIDAAGNFATEPLSVTVQLPPHLPAWFIAAAAGAAGAAATVAAALYILRRRKP